VTDSLLAAACGCLCAVDTTTRHLPLIEGDHGALRLDFTAAAGLYQFSVIADARDFDWDELYFNLHLFGNTGQRTGPWDFNFHDGNRALVPSYWVAVDGQRVGLWFFQRVSLEDIEHRRFRGRMAFHLPETGNHTLELTPYRPFTIRWMSAVLEQDPEDTLAPLAAWNGPGALTALTEPAAWEGLRAKLASTHAQYAPALERAFAWLDGRNTHIAEEALALLLQYRLQGNAAARETLLAVVDAAVEKAHWGNPQEDGYSHDGDMGAALPLRALAQLWHAAGDVLDADRRARLRAKLQLQGNRFMELALLNRDYWGGSVMQDHGWKSLFAFGTAALLLLDVVPEAARWATFALPRLRRALQAMPRDGAIPLSNYCVLYLYLDEPTHFREALRARTGEDIFAEPQWHAVIDYLAQVVRPQDFLMMLEAPTPLMGGNAFLNAIASIHGDGRAAALQATVLRTGEQPFSHPTQELGYYLGAIYGLLNYDPAVAPTPLPPRAPLAFFPDNGLATYYDAADDVTLTVRCGTFAGYNAYRYAQGPCDRMGSAPGAGHFTVTLGTAQRLMTPDSGYALTSALRTCLLVDGRGQDGDVGYPMSIPSLRDRGAEITFARWDAATHTGWIRLNLQPAYPDDLGLASYTRDLLLMPGREIVCRDRVVADAPHQWSWLFQGYRAHGLALDGLTATLGSAPALYITPRPHGPALTASIQQTPVVFSYSSASGFKPFDHVRYDSEPCATAGVEFVITWDR
jgi:hypothetical protein